MSCIHHTSRQKRNYVVHSPHISCYELSHGVREALVPKGWAAAASGSPLCVTTPPDFFSAVGGEKR